MIIYKNLAHKVRESMDFYFTLLWLGSPIIWYMLVFPITGRLWETRNIWVFCFLPSPRFPVTSLVGS